MYTPLEHNAPNRVSQTGSLTCIEQRHVPERYPICPNINFGPLTTTIDDMFQRGYWLSLTATGKDKSLYTARRCKVYLQDAHNRYRVGSISWGILQSSFNELGEYDLCQILDDRNLISTHSSTRVRMKYFYKPTDPWKPIMDKYPIRRKSVMVGNQTLREFVESELI